MEFGRNGGMAVVEMKLPYRYEVSLHRVSAVWPESKNAQFVVTRSTELPTVISGGHGN